MSKISILVCICVTLGVVHIGNAQIKLNKTKVNEHITVSLPDDFYPMSPSDLAQRFPSVRKPIGAYTDANRLVSFQVKQAASQWQEEDLSMASGFFKAGLANLYDRVKFLREDIVAIDKKEFAVFELETRVNGEEYSLDKKEAIRTYVYIQYLIVNGKTFVFSFICPIQLEKEWKQKVQAIMQSVEVKKSI